MAAVELLEPETGVSPGQACVFYDLSDGRGRLLGGGTIDATQTVHDAAAATQSSRAMETASAS
ncbi:MAG: aminomethyltransferase beta-barrel domain-containing protein [Tepidamorphaceae bacterium]